MNQLRLLKKTNSSYGGELLNTRKGRSTPRPLDTKNSMHIVLRSSKAKGAWSMRHRPNAKKVQILVEKFASKYGVRLHSFANVGNHLHLHIQLTKRFTYSPFIRALTGSIAMAITGVNRWNKAKTKLKFWDQRPFSRVVFGWKGFKSVKTYIQVNQLEGFGYPRDLAQEMSRQARWIDYSSA